MHISAHKLSSNSTKANKGEQQGTVPPKDKGWNKQTMGARKQQTTFSRGCDSRCARGCDSHCARGAIHTVQWGCKGVQFTLVIGVQFTL